MYDQAVSERSVKFFGIEFSRWRAVPGLWLFTSLQWIYTLGKVFLLVCFERSVTTIFPDMMQNFFTSTELLVCAGFYFGFVFTWLTALTYAVIKITHARGLNDAIKWSIFREAFFNHSQWKFRRPIHQPQRFFFYLYISVLAPWILVGSVKRFFKIKDFLRGSINIPNR